MIKNVLVTSNYISPVNLRCLPDLLTKMVVNRIEFEIYKEDPSQVSEADVIISGFHQDIVKFCERRLTGAWTWDHHIGSGRRRDSSLHITVTVLFENSRDLHLFSDDFLVPYKLAN